MHQGSGLTTRQMGTAPFGSIFVWADQHTGYAKLLALKLERYDLRIVGPSFLECSQNWMGLHYPALVLDHSCRLSPKQIVGYADALSYVRLPTGPAQWEDYNLSR